MKSRDVGNIHKYPLLAVILAGLLLLSPIIAYASVNSLSDIRIGKSSTDETRIVFDLANAADYHTFRLHNPERMVIDIDNTDNKFNADTLNFIGTPIERIRLGENEKQRLRIVLDLSQPVKDKVSTLPANKAYGERILLDLYVQSAINKLSKPVMDAKAKTGDRDVIVMIDPGHGGHDPGATGPGGLHEKNVVLAIAKKLQAQLNAQPGIKAELTRKGDYYISLRDRLSIARKSKADIFVAVHADAYKDSSSHGASVYALSLRGASSEAARWLAEKENYSELGGVNLNNKGDMLRSVLIDLSQTATISSSIVLGDDILGNIDDLTALHYKRVEQAAFVVLKSPDIPSVLIETGFISNPNDEKNLNNPAYQQKLADSIAEGIEKYFDQRPPAGTYFAAKAEAKRKTA